MARNFYYDKTQLSHLHEVLMQAGRLRRKLPTISYSATRSLCSVDCNEVYPNLYLGNEGAARTKQYLLIEGITHILNTAEGKRIGQIDTGSAYYCDLNIIYLGLNLMDIPSENIQKYFYLGADFIENALANNGKVLVHCHMGISRSASIVCAFLMIKKGMNVTEALMSIQNSRYIRPNDGFLYQLMELEKQLNLI